MPLAFCKARSVFVTTMTGAWPDLKLHVPSARALNNASQKRRRKMQRFATSVILSFLVFFGACETAALAATIASPALHMKAAALDDKVNSSWPTDPVQCDLILDGDIAAGDAEELQRQFKEISDGTNAFSFFLCL